MLLSRLLGKTLRQPPANARQVSHALLARAGYVRSQGTGLFSYLPLGTLALQRLRARLRQELSSLGGQEVELPLSSAGEAGEALARLVRREVDSYRQLPTLLFRLAPRTRRQAHSRTGLFGASERPFVEIDAFGSAPLRDEAAQVVGALDRLLTACDVAWTWAECGDHGRDDSRRGYYFHDAGDEEVAICRSCGYAAARSWSVGSWPEPLDEPELAPEEIATPGCETIAGLAEFLDIPASRTLKMVFYSLKGRVHCLVIRGDRAIDEDKLTRLLGTDQYYASLEEELAAVGAVGGYASPIGLDTDQVRVIADPSIRSGKNFVSGANRPGYHIRNVNVPRDFRPGEWVDLALIEAGDPCPQCGAALEVKPAFALAQAGAPAPCVPEAEYLDAEGRGQPLWQARWALDVGRLLAAVVEEHYDDYGLIWPVACAPFDVHLVVLDARKEVVKTQATALYDRLQAGGFSVLYDDRSLSAGVKFNDADLIGIPLRLTVSKRSAKEGLVEAKWRAGTERLKLDEEGLELELGRLRSMAQQ